MTDIVALCMNPSIDISTSVDRVMPIRKLRCAASRRDPGGGGINVARVVRRLGTDVTAVYPMGGATGQLLRRLVDQEGLQSLALQTAEETREDFTVLETESGDQFRFILPGPQLAEREWRACLDAVASFKGRAKFLVASGSLPPGVPQDFYGRIARLAKDIGAKLVLDTSGPPLQAALKEGAYLVKPNLRELSALGHTPPEGQGAWIEASRSLVSGGGAEIVALTLGDKGALLVARDQVWRAQALPVKPVSTVGAGDSFLGGMVWSLVAGHSLRTAFRYGNAAGSAAVLAPGTGLCRLEDVGRLFGQIAMHELGQSEPAAALSSGGPNATEDVHFSQTSRK
jgi:6-phosphofructokinase 2